MKIIDFARKGNLVRFYLGKDTDPDRKGDDWDTVPYGNAAKVEEKYICGIADIVFPFGTLVLEPSSGTIESQYSKNDLLSGRVPCIVVVPEHMVRTIDAGCFSEWCLRKNVLKFYFGDQLQPTKVGVPYAFTQIVPGANLVCADYAQSEKDTHAGMPNSPKRQAVPIWEKENLSLSEAAAYFGIGQNKLRDLSDSRNCNFVLFVGNKRLIKRKLFEKYLENEYSV